MTSPHYGFEERHPIPVSGKRYPAGDYAPFPKAYVPSMAKSRIILLWINILCIDTGFRDTDITSPVTASNDIFQILYSFEVP